MFESHLYRFVQVIVDNKILRPPNTSSITATAPDGHSHRQSAQRYFRCLSTTRFATIRSVAQIGEVGVNAERPCVAVGFNLLSFAG